MSRDEKVKYWIDLAEYDLKTARAMLKTKRYLYVAFMCHQVIEKMLKGYYSYLNDKIPPYSHNLRKLADSTGIYNELSEEQKEFLEILQPLNIQARYPEYKEELLKQLRSKKCSEIVKKTTELSRWIKKLLSK
jgi:HEPN domain-containing protein